MGEGARVYSYLRFSDPRQAAGHSADRQLKYAEEWAAGRGLALDQTLTLRDEGLSAYHQRHIKSGALGAFLAAIDEGRIAPGSVLVVEGLDRLSRAEPIQAQAQLAQIINAGITVVTASDGREYNRASLKAQPMDLVYSLLVMIRAHEESDTKSRRVSASIRRLCESWQAGTYRGVIRNGKDPGWVRWTGEHFELVPERAEAVLRAIALYRQGLGYVRIVRRLAEEGLALSDSGSNAQHIYRLVRARTLVGTKTIRVDGEEFQLQGYYPALLTAAQFDALQHVSGQRAVRPGRGEIPGVITGLGITTCGYCGTLMLGQNSMYRARPDGSLAEGHRRLLCTAYSHDSGCPVGGSCSVGPVERAVLTYCADQMNLSALLAGDDRVQQLQARLAREQAHQVDIEQQLDRLTAALVSDEGAAPLAFLRKARELEATLSTVRGRVEECRRELVSVSHAEMPALADAWGDVLEGVATLDTAARLRARQLVADTFERIVVYTKGVKPERKAAALDLLLVAKGGQRRLLTIDRRSGEWQAERVKN